MNQKVQAMLEVNLRAKEQEVSRLQDKVAELYEKVSEASSADDDGVLRKAQLSRDQLMQKVALLEHSCRAREKEIQRLKESLEDKVRREEYRTIRDKETYERLRRQVLQGPAAVQSGTKGLKSADVVALYEVRTLNGRSWHDLRSSGLEASAAPHAHCSDPTHR
jgi:phage shock protein A